MGVGAGISVGVEVGVDVNVGLEVGVGADVEVWINTCVGNEVVCSVVGFAHEAKKTTKSKTIQNRRHFTILPSIKTYPLLCSVADSPAGVGHPNPWLEGNTRERPLERPSTTLCAALMC